MAITKHHFGSIVALASTLMLGACANMPGAGYPPGASSGYPATVGYPPATGYQTAPGYQATGYNQYGVVQSIELVQTENAGGIGVGTVVGAVVGGLLGHQVGSGNGNTAATVVGVAGGALLGHEVEKRNQQTSDAYRINMRMNDGSYQSVTQSTSGDIRVGDRVLVANGVAQRY